ncbi:MAG TPA: TIGR03790 family protein [Phycisphaerae bacterium]|nr:TIGR03790 family protein [Phycisphaerae bacterium]
MIKSIRNIPLAGLVAGLMAAPAGALSPEEVLVVANERDADSVALARHYAEKRGIPAGNILLVSTTTAASLSRESYNASLRDPVRKALSDAALAAKVRCLCLLYGVPYRVHAPADTPEQKAQAALAQAVVKLRFRLATDYQLAATIGKDFPPPRTDGLQPLGKLFASPVPEPPKPLPAVSALREDIRRVLAARQVEMGRLADPARRKIASRQVQALHLDVYGFQGLIEHLRDTGAAGGAGPYQQQLEAANRRLAQVRQGKAGPEDIGQVLELIEQIGGIALAATYAERLQTQLRNISPVVNAGAAVDSELALALWEEYPLPGPAANPLYWRARGGPAKKVLLTSRIDGPSAADAMRIVKASVETEAKGLDGVFYIDAGGPERVPAPARKHFDDHLLALHRFVAGKTKLQVVLDEKPTVFAKDTCPRAALYVGWYSLKRYVPAFMWTPGAVGYHVASWEAVTLRDPNSQEWCPKMIQNGVAATLGAVAEPLLSQFPDPEDFFPLLLTGQYTVAECYWRTIPAASWQMLLLADPLYNPFKARPAVAPSALPAGLAP